MISVAEAQFWNACSPTDKTVAGILIEFNDKQPEKEKLPIVEINWGNSILSKDMHLWNA